MKTNFILFSNSFLVLFLGACNANVVQPEIINEINLPVQTATNANSSQQSTSQNNTVNQKPIIQQIQANPTQISSPEDILTLQAMIHERDNDPLQMSWSATKGTLSSTQGVSTTWSPKDSLGNLVKGIATITLLVSDNRGQTATASVNINVNADGSANINAPAFSTPPTNTQSTSETESTQTNQKELPPLPTFTEEPL